MSSPWLASLTGSSPWPLTSCPTHSLYGTGCGEPWDAETSPSDPMTLPASQTLCSAICDAPLTLPDVVSTNGRTMRLVERRGAAAIYVDCFNLEHFEVIRIRAVAETTWPNGRTTPAREVYPGTSSWGSDAWTYTRGSHSHPLRSARARLMRLA
jgi:hypothetical protein